MERTYNKVDRDAAINIIAGGDVTVICGPAGFGGLRGTLTVYYGSNSVKGFDMDFTVPDDAPVKVKVTWVDAHNHPAQVDGDTTWSSGDEEIATVTVDPTDSTIATVAAGSGALGTVEIKATADADRGSGVEQIFCTGNATVVAGQAVGGTMAPVA